MSFLALRKIPQLELEQIFDDFWKLPSQAADMGDWSPPVDIEEERNHFLVSIEVPGVKREELKIEIDGSKLTVSGERKSEKKQREGGLYLERRYGRFERTFALPAHVDSSEIEANYQDGVLKIYVPKSASAKARQIKIGELGKPSFFEKLMDEKKDDVPA